MSTSTAEVAAGLELPAGLKHVVVGRAPIYDDVVRCIGRPPADAVFTYGDTVYCSDPANLDPLLLLHEATHARQHARAGGPDKWWARYLSDREFRLEQEVEAYRVQFRFSRPLPRPVRRQLLRHLARSLAHPMYGSIVKMPQALALIVEGT